jgi:hypothetical protein
MTIVTITFYSFRVSLLLFCYLTPSSFFVLVHLLISIIYKSSTVPNGSLPKYNYLIENREKTLSLKGC